MNTSNFRPQVNIELIIGSTELPSAFKASIVHNISKACGGCTEVMSMGYWIEEAGTTKADTYKGTLATEETLHLQVTCEKHKFDTVYADLQETTAVACLAWGLDVNWVHCKVTESLGAHFSINNIVKGM